jgi:competence protein ComEA
LEKYFSKKSVLLFFCGLIILTLIAYTILHRQQQNTIQEEEFGFEETPQVIEESTVEKITVIVVDVKGEVVSPGVYEFEPGKRLHDAIQMAGGFTENADLLAVNLAAMLHDEMVIYVPKVGEGVEQSVVEMYDQTNQNVKISINSSTIEDLQQLTGIGPAKAAAIKSYIDENGPLQTVEELLNISGIGEKTLEKIRDEITVK